MLGDFRWCCPLGLLDFPPFHVVVSRDHYTCDGPVFDANLVFTLISLSFQNYSFHFINTMVQMQWRSKGWTRWRLRAPGDIIWGAAIC